jgi:hypothetical protein
MDKNCSREEIIELCNKYSIRNYTIGKDIDGYYVDVIGDVRLSCFGLISIPIRFNYVSDGFYCYNNELTSLEGCPKYVGGIFDCDHNQLQSLKGGPISVGSNFYCDGNNLLSVEYSPIRLGGIISCFITTPNEEGATSLVESFHHFFDLGYADDKILTCINLVGIRRQWVLNGIING